MPRFDRGRLILGPETARFGPLNITGLNLNIRQIVSLTGKLSAENDP
jgi:hypothetical protein